MVDRIRAIVFQIKFLDCVIGRPPSTTYGGVRLTQGGSLWPCQKHYLKAYSHFIITYSIPLV